MLRVIDAYKPLPKNVNYKIDYNHVGCFFDYKRYVDVIAMCKNLRQVADEDLYRALEVFSKHHYKYRDTMYHNLETVEREEVMDDGLLGYYILCEDLNVIAYTSWYDAYHELLHLASTYQDLDRKILYSGFSVTSRHSRSVGEGLTEGYVDLQCSKDLLNGDVIVSFTDNDEYYNVPPNIFATLICRQLEVIVGEEQLEDMFFRDGFNRLKKFLMQYKDEKEVLKFFKNMDAAAMASKHRIPSLNNKTLYCQSFLRDICEKYFPEKIHAFAEEELLKKDSVGFELLSVKVAKELDKRRESKNNKR